MSGAFAEVALIALVVGGPAAIAVLMERADDRRKATESRRVES